MEKNNNKIMLFAGGGIVLSIVVLIAGLLFFNSRVQASASSMKSGDLSQTVTIPLNADQDENEMTESDEDGDVDMYINDTRIRWNGEKWEYSTDGGQTWTDTPPDGVNVDEDGGLTMWQGEIEDFDIDTFLQEIDDMIDSIQSEIKERYGDILPEDAQAGSFFTYGDSIARKVDGTWEFSSDGGETWTNEPPEGIEVSEDGTRFRIGGGEGDIEDFDADGWLEEWYNQWYNENSSIVTGQETAV